MPIYEVNGLTEGISSQLMLIITMQHFAFTKHKAETKVML